MIDLLRRKVQILVEFFGIAMALDILIIAAALLGLYRVFRASGSWKVVTGILVAAGLLALADLMDLKGVMWVYSRLSGVVLIGLVVVFQPEIRKLFERAATMRRRSPGPTGTALPSILAEAAFECAKRKWGAIVVVPGNDPLEAWVSGGIEVGAAPSLPLLLSIFDPHSPGHDGAASIVDGRIDRIALRLPLSKSEKLPAHYGTRHNASLGLSEVTDGLVICVSEERGAVSVFAGGRMTAARSPSDVVAAIVEHWDRTGSFRLVEKGGGRWWIAVEAAVCLFVAFWVSTRAVWETSQIVERSYDVAIEYATPPEMALVGEKPAAIAAHLAGAVSALEKFEAGERKVKIDMTAARPGRQTIVVTEDLFDLPKGVTLVGVEPAGFDVTLNRIEERDVPVRPQLVGETLPGVVVEAVEVYPPTVRAFTAADTATDSAAFFVTTSPVPLEEVRETTRFGVQIVAPPNILPAGKRWPEAEVRVVVAEAPPPRAVRRRPAAPPTPPGR